MKVDPVDSIAIPKVSIDWYRSTPWWRLASQSLTISWRASHLGLCAIGLILTQLIFQLSFIVFAPDLPSAENVLSVTQPDSIWIANPSLQNRLGNSSITPLGVWSVYTLPLFQWLEAPSLRQTAHSLTNFIALLVIWSFIGGCLSRRSAIELGTRLTAPWAETIRLVLQRWQSIAWSIAMPLGLVALLSIFPLLAGWLSNIPYLGTWLGGLLMLPIILLSIGIGWSAAITLLGFSLSVSAVVCEKQADAFDGLARSAAYTFQRPLTLGLCVIASEFVGSLGGILVSLVLSTGASICLAFFSIGSFDDSPASGTWLEPVVQGIVPLFIVSFGYSFFWTASTATYLILRRDVDHAEFDLIDLVVESEPKSLPELPKKPSESDTANAVSVTEVNPNTNVADEKPHDEQAT